MKIFSGVLIVILAFVLFLVIRTIIITSKARKLSASMFTFSDEEINAYAERLSEMIKCKTVSVKGEYDDTEFKKLRETMEKLFPLVHEKAEKMFFSDDCWVYKIPGKDNSHNIMLMSHHDVVEVSGEWKFDGFSAHIEDGKMYGRGTVDTKTPLFAEFSAVEELLAEGFTPENATYILPPLTTRNWAATAFRKPTNISKKTVLPLM